MSRRKPFCRCLAAVVLAAVTATSALPVAADYDAAPLDAASWDGIMTTASTASVTFTAAQGTLESAYAEWNAVSGATDYHVYVKSGSSYTLVDNMLVRQYPTCFRVDVPGLAAGSYQLKVVPVIGGKEDESKAGETAALNVEAHDRSSFGFVEGTSSGAYNEDGTLRENAVVLYVTEKTKDTVSMDVVTSSKGATTNAVGIQEILDLLKKGYDTRPVCIRIVGMVTDPAVTEGGDLVISGSSDSKRYSAGLTIEGIGADATLNGFGVRLKNVSNVEVRNIGFMNCNSSEGDDCSLQQSNDHIWVHNCDFFYGDAGSDADQAKGDGALDCKKSTYITFSYNHFYDNGKCNLLGLSEGTTDDLYITYHHNWYDHSDSRHPRVRYYSAHVYNNYYDGNAKYGIGATMGASIFSENNYFRNCKYPMLTSMQGSDVAGSNTPTFSKEDGGTIKSYGNYMEGQNGYITYQTDNVEFDAYEASSREEQVPASVTSKKGGNTYNNFDTSSKMYAYTPDAAADVPSIVTAKAGRVQGGDFKWQFDNSVDDASYAVNQALKDALVNYKPTVIAIGGGFTDNTSDPIVTTATTAVSNTTTTTKTTVSVTASSTGATTVSTTGRVTVPTTPDVPAAGDIFCSPNGTGSGDSEKDPTSVTNAISKLTAGHTIYLLGGTYKFSEMILIDSSNSGTANAMKTIKPYNGADVVFDFSGQGEANASKRGIVLDGDYWHFYGFEITKAADNGMLLSGSNNTVERMVFNDNQDTGLQLSRYNTSAATIADWPSNNLILNCTSKNNCDDKTMENADGFAAKLTCGEGNVFDGCMSYNNSDDGWDLYAKTETGPIGVVTIQNCAAFRNGYTEFGEGYGNCDGNGFKLGGGGVGTAHVVKNCLAFENLNCGFTDNNNPKLGSLTNCTAYNNNLGGNKKYNIACYRCTDPGADFSNVISYFSKGNLTSNLGVSGVAVANDKFCGTIQNSIYYNGAYYQVGEKTAIDNKNNTKVGTKGAAISDDDFEAVTAPQMGTDFDTAWRNSDGSINTHGFMQVKESSALYSILGAKFQQIDTPPVVTTATTKATEETTTAAVTSETTRESASETTASAATSDSTASKTTEKTTAAPEETTTAPVTTVSVDPSALYGDVNLDGDVDLADAVLLNKAISGAVELGTKQRINAECYADGVVTVDDSMTLLQFLVHLRNSLPVQPS
ncbi:right-handed parallel beta-helix repeat-containing protein [uncultured Ruminococcus sp.]|uniref:pectate lyase family protein n=1 Tax=uncultured Ruminococcus sp. TaxID=165186 RepID=UPI002658AEAC|nr:right-handed parallel beta-helix repeat-containing protein [uncultured Ruminococcus sp.]